MTTKVAIRERPDAGTAAEAASLRRGMRDLISLLALPAITIGDTPQEFVCALLEIMLGLLALDFAYAEIADSNTGKPLVLIRHRRAPDTATAPDPQSNAATWSTSNEPIEYSPFTVQKAAQRGDISVARVRLGWEPESGYLAAGARRATFPTHMDRLLLRVGANLAANGLLARLGRASKDLERTIAEHTSALRLANAELETFRTQPGAGRKQLEESARPGDELVIARGGLAPWQLRRAKELMSANLDEQFPLSRLAEECGLSVRHFARAFRHSTGVPPHRWLMTHRLNRAKEQLRDPALSLTEIALACGFADQSHFTRMFTTRLGMSPGAWRRMRMWQLTADVAASCPHGARGVRG
jgi:AraC-like DNA-binding protein